MHQKSRRRLAADQVCLAPARDPLDFRLHHPLDQARQVLVQPRRQHGAQRFANHLF